MGPAYVLAETEDVGFKTGLVEYFNNYVLLPGDP